MMKKCGDLDQHICRKRVLDFLGKNVHKVYLLVIRSNMVIISKQDRVKSDLMANFS